MTADIGAQRIAIVHQASKVVVAFDTDDLVDLRAAVERLAVLLDVYDDTQRQREARRVANGGTRYREQAT